ncbi:MAG TPA: hypothetical protein VK826_15950 [Bacteroidia bacterium]|nr:hypothetical protein [Bacteroidia bacterium]
MRDYPVIGGETITIRRTDSRTLIFIYIAVMGDRSKEDFDSVNLIN